jgi:hypothetical protein
VNFARPAIAMANGRIGEGGWQNLAKSREAGDLSESTVQLLCNFSGVWVLSFLFISKLRTALGQINLSGIPYDGRPTRPPIYIGKLHAH